VAAECTEKWARFHKATTGKDEHTLIKSLSALQCKIRIRGRTAVGRVEWVSANARRGRKKQSQRLHAFKNRKHEPPLPCPLI
jgi:hypothetical protein